MKKIKLFALIGIISLSYIIGMCMGFGLCATTQTANAAPVINNIQETQGVHHEIVYVGNEKFIVFKYNTDIEVVRY